MYKIQGVPLCVRGDKWKAFAAVMTFVKYNIIIYIYYCVSTYVCVCVSVSDEGTLRIVPPRE